jgi:hypothetical protein
MEAGGQLHAPAALPPGKEQEFCTKYDNFRRKLVGNLKNVEELGNPVLSVK